jgi:hypothetical protein
VTKRCPKKRFGKMRWSAREDRIVETVYPDYREMQRRMPARSYGAIRSRARKLGVATSRHVWTNQDMAKLRTLYRRGATRAEVAAAFPLLSQGQICSKAAHVRLVRVRRTPYALGVPPLDDVRRRAAAQGLTWRQLDTLAKTGRYFQQTTRRVDWQHLAHAIEMLGGTIEIIWFSDGTASPQFENG